MTRRVTSIATPTAHLVGPGKLKVINGRLAFSTGKATPLRIDPKSLRTVLCYGRVGVSDEAIRVLFQHNVEVAWLTPAGQHCRGRLVRANSSGTTLRLKQYEVLLDHDLKRQFARDTVVKKIASQVAAARHYQRQGHPETGGILRQIKRLQQRAVDAGGVEVLRGVEGAASAAWFTFFGKLLLPPWKFTQRVRRPPTDPVNALLSLGYTLLLNRTIARCDAIGLEVTLGALHEFRPGRPSLACDLIEPLRVPAVDRWVVRLCNEQRLKPKDFRRESKGVRLQPEVLPKVLADWETTWYKCDHEQLMDGSVLELAARIRRHAPALPILPEEGQNGQGSGKSATPFVAEG